MFALPGLLALVFIDYVRPQEYVPFLEAVPLLHVATAFALIGFVLDLRLALSRREPAPHLLLTALFLAWCLVTVLVRAPDQFTMRAQALLVPIAIYAAVAHGIQSFRSLQVMGAVLLAICLGLAALGVHQGLSSYGCHRIAVSGGHLVYLYDGRPCSEEDRNVCENESAEPGADYVCEKVGLLGTQSDHGRVRYRGTLQDPNELSLALGIAVPFAFAFLDRRRSLPRALLVAATVVGVGLSAYFTQSRGGQLVFLTVLGVYFVRRMGVRRGLAVGVVLALPLLLFGGRAGAEVSTMERLECWWVGLHLVVASPGFGVGFGQFTDHHNLTAHNSFILATAELGLPGMLLFTSIIYVAIKIPVQALRAHLPPVARSWAIALLASTAGLAVGSFFLSYSYKDVLWIYVGLTGVLYHAVRRHEPGFEVRFGVRDLGIVAAADAVLLFALVGYTGSKLGW
jgi:O-antigen ligase/polysaccharide polymerase Wzy-like membrane protein